MKLRMIIVGTAAALALAGSSFALGAGTHEKAAPRQVTAQPHPMPASLSKLGKAARVRVRCGNIQCVNGALTAIGQAFRQMRSCIDYIEVGQFDGYAFSNDGGASYFQTTALDAVSPGDPSTHVAILTC